MRSKTISAIKDLENQISTGYKLPIFKGCVIINKYGIEKLIDTIYASLPEDILEARKLLKEKNIEIPASTNDFDNKGLYDYLKDLEIQFNEGMVFINYVIVQIKAIENLLDRIYATLPKEIEKAETLDK